MKKIVHVSILLWCFLLASCGGSNGDSGLLSADLGLDLSGLQVTPVDQSIPVDFGLQYTATAILTDGSTQDVTADPALLWRSSDSTIATIDPNTGFATGVMPGEVTISASGTANGVAFSQSVTLTVTDVSVTELQVTPVFATVPVGFEQQYIATAIFSDDHTLDVTTNPSLSWTSSDPSIASIDANSGLAIGLVVGEVTINASGTANGTPFSQSVTLTVTDAVVTELQVTPVEATVPVGFEQQYMAMAIFSDGHTLDVTTHSALSWSSSDPSIASIGANTGLAVGQRVGDVIISAFGEANGLTFTQTALLTVTASSVTGLEVSPPRITVPAGFEQQYTATATFSDGHTLDVTTNEALSWSSGNTNIATIDSNTGLATAVGIELGDVVITASGIHNGEQFSESAILTVTNSIVTDLNISPLTMSIPAGRQQPYTAIATFSDEHTLDVTTHEVLSWSSGNTNIATIDHDTGLATAVGIELGDVTITASGSYQGVAFSRTAILTVTDATVNPGSSVVTIELNSLDGQTFSSTIPVQLEATSSFSDGSSHSTTESNNDRYFMSWSIAGNTSARITDEGLLNTTGVISGTALTITATGKPFTDYEGEVDSIIVIILDLPPAATVTIDNRFKSPAVGVTLYGQYTYIPAADSIAEGESIIGWDIDGVGTGITCSVIDVALGQCSYVVKDDDAGKLIQFCVTPVNSNGSSGVKVCDDIIATSVKYSGNFNLFETINADLVGYSSNIETRWGVTSSFGIQDLQTTGLTYKIEYRPLLGFTQLANAIVSQDIEFCVKDLDKGYNEYCRRVSKDTSEQFLTISDGTFVGGGIINRYNKPKGVAPATVYSDTTTGLKFMRPLTPEESVFVGVTADSTVGDSNVTIGHYSLANAMQLCSLLAVDGGGWRLPTFDELRNFNTNLPTYNNLVVGSTPPTTLSSLKYELGWQGVRSPWSGIGESLRSSDGRLYSVTPNAEGEVSIVDQDNKFFAVSCVK